MAKVEINKDKEPVRLFKSDFLEFFTHISPVVVLIIFIPIILFFITSAIINRQAGAAIYIPLGVILGIFIWTPSEYLLHRFVFHYHPKKAWQERITFLFHGVHHAQPHDKTRLVMPPVVSLPLAAVFYGLFFLIIGVLFKVPHWVAPIYCGFMIGYVVYDMTHYATHHFPLKGSYGKFLKRYHMWHHFRTPDQRYGVSSPLWDMVFSTYPKD